MRRGRIFWAACAALVAITGFAVAPAKAITPATPDGNGHPNVGAVAAEWITPGVKDLLCTGTLITSRIFLTAAHCDPAEFGLSRNQVWVSFDPVYRPGVSPLVHGTFVPDPRFTQYQGQGGFSDTHDIGVIRLDLAQTMTPAQLPTLNYLKTLDLKSQRFTAVGYGTSRVDKTKGPNNFFDTYSRNVATQGFRSLAPEWLNLSENQSTGSGGTCFGDSGGPHFLGNSNLLVSTTITGDSVCVSLDKTLRLDTQSQRQFLASQGVPLP